jgi:hypothetical protein
LELVPKINIIVLLKKCYNIFAKFIKGRVSYA